VEEASGLCLSWSAPVDPARTGTSWGSAARDDRPQPLRTKDRRAASRILYAEGGVRDACLQRDGLLAGAGPSNRRRRPAPWDAAVPAHSSLPIGPLHRPIAMLLLNSLAHLRTASRGPASSHRERTSASCHPADRLGGQPWTDGPWLERDSLARRRVRGGSRSGAPPARARGTFLDSR